MMSNDMKRTNIYLTEKQIRALKIEAAKTGVSMGERIRLLVDAYLAKPPKRRGP